jgi:choloylglycine hydrolase
VLTNNPPFDYHRENVRNYVNVTRSPAVNRFADGIKITAYSNGMGGIGLPGDFSSASRFVKAAFVRANAVCDDDEESSVNQFFHMLTAVEQVRGCVKIGDAYEITQYSSCVNTDRGIYYFTAYDHRQIAAVRLRDHDLNGMTLTMYDLPDEQMIRYLSQPS